MRLEELPKWAFPAAVGAVSFVAGAAVGYFATKRQYDRIEGELQTLEETQLELDFNTTELENEMNKAAYTLRALRQETEKIVGATRDLAIVKDLPVESSQAHHPSNHTADPRNVVVEDSDLDEPDTEPDEGVVHIFAQTNADPEWNYEVECQRRTPDAPYVLHRDEFFADEMGYQELTHPETLTFYKGDQILVDQGDRPIYDIQGQVGDLKFGHGSGDPSIFYVRNEALEAEYEIVEDDGYYQEAVLGEEIERDMEREDLRHSRRPGKFRDD